MEMNRTVPVTNCMIRQVSNITELLLLGTRSKPILGVTTRMLVRHAAVLVTMRGNLALITPQN